MKPEPNYYVYKMTTDNGGAPCVLDNLLSLAICKPKIRSTAERDSVVFGFGGKVYDERLIYIAKVTTKPPKGIYYCDPTYTMRPDCIYKKLPDGSAKLKKGADYHRKGDRLFHDVGRTFDRAWVLLSSGNDFRYFGKEGTKDYQKYCSVKALVKSLTQGHRVIRSSELHRKDLYCELTLLIKEVWKKYSENKLGEPTTKNRSKPCRG